MNTIFIGIAGGTGSGKTTLTEHLVSRFGDDIAVVHHDNYYKRQDCSFEERCKQNYDHPDAFDTDLMIQDLKKLKAIRYAGAAVCLALAAYFMAPLVMGILHIGMVYPAALLALAAAMLLRPRWFRRLPRWLRRTGGALLGAGLALLAAVLVMMAVQAGNRPGPEDCTVVVLGCQVSASGEPTVMLRDRIDAAYDYLTAHPESRCVASGGQNDNEPISEAACIRNTLAARGIDPDRILLEDRSRSTEENLRFTAEIIRQQGLNPRVAIASDNFHQLRASVWARRCGLEAESLGCASWWPLGPGYWAREAVAVVVLEVGSLL